MAVRTAMWSGPRADRAPRTARLAQRAGWPAVRPGPCLWLYLTVIWTWILIAAHWFYPGALSVAPG